MLKSLMLLALVAMSSFLIIDAFPIEVDLVTEAQRVQDIEGYKEIERISYQEHLLIEIDKVNSKNKISVVLLSTDAEYIELPNKLKAEVLDPSVISITITNEYNCANEDDYACVIITVDRKGLGDNLDAIKRNAHVITDNVLDQGFVNLLPFFWEPRWFSTEVVAMSVPTADDKTESLEKTVVKVTYTIKNYETFKLFNAATPAIIGHEVLQGGGFLNVAEELSKNYFSDFTITYNITEQKALRTIIISLVCSNELREFTYCLTDDINEQSDSKISPLDFLQLENINRSELFSEGFMPLNSIVRVTVNSEKDLQVKSVNSNHIKKLSVGDIQNDGWFFDSKSGNKIDGRYLFGSEQSTDKNNLIFSVGPYSGDNIEIQELQGGGGCLIATAAFGSEMAPQVQYLREIRDNTVLQTKSGSAFMVSFNQFYYSFSPAIADYERENIVFKEAVKLTLTPLLTSLTLLQYADIDTEYEMLGYGISIMLLNIGIYFIAPAVLIMKVKKLIS